MEGTESVSAPTPESSAPASAPASAASTPSAAAATPETSTPSTKPTSFLDAFERLAAAEPPDPAAAASTDPATTPPAATDPAKQGPVPLVVHQQALNNARAKEREAVTAEFDRQYGWAKKVDQATLTEMAGIANQLQTDPWGHIRTLIGELSAHPTHGPQTRTEIARMLAGFRTPAPVSDDPDVQIVDAAGQVTGGTYSAEKVRAIVAAAVQDALGKEVAPLKEDFTRRQAERQQQVREHQAKQQQIAIEAKADTVLAEMTEILDGDKALYAEADALWAQHPDWTAHRVALAVRKTHIAPRLQGQATSSAIAAMKAKAAGNTAAGSASSALPARPTTVKELAAWMEAHAGG
jgi:hypothetical protein